MTFSVPEEERYHHGMDYFKARLILMMGGRAAYRLMYNQPYAGHENDLKQATRLARYMVTHWGMSDRLGPMSFRIGEEHVFLGKEIQEPRDFSEGTAQLIDQEVQRLLFDADQRAYDLLAGNRADLDKLAQLRPGDIVTFRRISVAEAEAVCRRKRAELNDWLLRLRVVRAAGTDPPGLGRGLVRTLQATSGRWLNS